MKFPSEVHHYCRLGFLQPPLHWNRIPALKFRQELHSKRFIFKHSELPEDMKVILILLLIR
jgi:hypothetical protein